MNSFSRNRRKISVGLLISLSGISQTLQAQTLSSMSDRPLRILVIGDSLSAEYGLTRGTGWVELLKQSMAGAQPPVDITNASISGDTTSGGLSRIDAVLSKTQPDIVIIELGANDALRGLPLNMTKNNLLNMTRFSKKAGARVLLAGMQIPPNYGREYTDAFKNVFVDVARDEDSALIPFFLEGIAEDPAMFQADTIHPNELAQPILMQNVRRALMPLIERTQSKRG